MAKRFTDTDKWKDEWFTELEPVMKIFWAYLCDNCDHAGIWKVNFRVASSVIGVILDKQSALKALGGRIEILSIDKWFIVKFISFQYPKGLTHANSVHRGVLKLLEYNKIESSPYLAPGKVLGSSSVGSKEQDKDMDKDKDVLPSYSLKEECVKIDQVQVVYDGIVFGKGRLTPCRGLSSKSIQDFLTTVSFKEFQNILTWREVFIKTTHSNFLNGTEAEFVATLPWLVIHHNALSVLNGQYSGTANAQKGRKSTFKLKTNGITPTPENPTGNPYKAQLDELRRNKASNE